MEQFLKHVASSIYDQHREHLDEVCILFPNKRAGVFFNQYLSKLITQPVFVPDYFTINEFFQQYSGLQVSDNLKLIFELYRVYQSHFTHAESFDEFFPWGETLLSDFDDIDKYLVDAEKLFTNLADVKAIEHQFSFLDEEQIAAIRQFWDTFRADSHSKQQQDFLYLWRRLLPLYQDFRGKLKKSNLAYEGMLNRDVVENQIANQTIRIGYQKMCIVGFNALNKCETKLFQYLQQENLAAFYWDYDAYYTEPARSHHEAGLFIRDNLRRFPPEKLDTAFNNLSAPDKDIQIINAVTETGQAKIVSNLLAEWQPDTLDEHTAIVLADENLLVPLLHSLPESTKDINITMGYPVRNSFISGFIENLISLQRQSKETESAPLFHYQDVFAILRNPYIHELDKENIDRYLHSLRETNQVYINPQDALTHPLFKSLFIRQSGTLEFMKSMLAILFELFRQQDPEQENTHMIHKEIIYKTYTHLKRIKDILEETGLEIKPDTLSRLIRKSAQNLRVNFSGEPLKGLQILGILETRVLDFQQLIILSLNEGIFPKKQAAPSFIPFNLRKGFQLPTIQNQDSIYAYYFYRLIQRAEKIRLVHHVKTSGLQTGEISRYLYQLMYEPAFRVSERSFQFSIQSQEPLPITIQKSDAVMERLHAYDAESGKGYVSPSAINTYLDCSLKFYYRYIARIQEKEELLEEPDALMFGNILHKVMEELYAPWLQTPVTSTLLDELLKDKKKIQDTVEIAFREVFFGNEQHPSWQPGGQQDIIMVILNNYLQQLLHIDKQFAPFTPLHLEEKFSLTETIQVNNRKHAIRIGGKIDRIDQIEDRIRVIDYKTGDAKYTAPSVEALFEKGNFNRNPHLMQLLLYCLLYERSAPNKTALSPGLYGLKDLFNPKFDEQIKISRKTVYDASDYLETFTEGLQGTLSELYNREVPFTQVEDSRICEYCPYNGICHR